MAHSSVGFIRQDKKDAGAIQEGREGLGHSLRTSEGEVASVGLPA